MMAAIDTARGLQGQTSGTAKNLLALVATLAIAIVLGFSSAWYAIERGTPLTTAHIGPWSSWLLEGDPSADAYTQAHIARNGRLPLAAASGRTFIARTDSEGRPLTSACEYEVQGPPLHARWWSIALYNADGRSIDNPSQRSSITGNELVRHSDGRYRVFIARNARPENWLPSGSSLARDLMLVLRLYGPRIPDERSDGQAPESRLPTIERKLCD